MTHFLKLKVTRANIDPQDEILHEMVLLPTDRPTTITYRVTDLSDKEVFSNHHIYVSLHECNCEDRAGRWYCEYHGHMRNE